MSEARKSRISDDRSLLSRISDAYALGDILRVTRLDRHLSQVELAGKLGLRQRQISDLERATVDPRLSTIQNVARALDLELMLVPRHLIAAVEALQRAGRGADKRPLYSLGDDDMDDAAGEPQPEVGDGTEPAGQRADPSRSRRISER